MTSRQFVSICVVLLVLAVILPRIIVFGALGIAIAMWAGLLASVALLFFVIVGGVLLAVERAQEERAAQSKNEAGKEEPVKPDYRRAA
jgi:hypothetical protein